MTPAETLAKAKQLDGFLGNAVKEIRAMNKFAETASKIKASLDSMNAEADDLSTDADKTMSTFMAAAAKYHGLLNDAREGIKAMEEAAAAMVGNGSPLPDSPPVSPPLPPVSEEPVKVEEPAPAPEPMPDEPTAPEPESIPEPVVEPTPLPAVDPTANGNAPA